MLSPLRTEVRAGAHALEERRTDSQRRRTRFLEVR